MGPTLFRGKRVVRWGGIIFSAAIAIAAGPACAATLFPEPLHFVREISDPMTAAVSVVDEYCVGNRVISLAREKTVIADYEKQTITEIDRRENTYSVTRFADVARLESTSSQSLETTRKFDPAGWSFRPAGNGAANSVEATRRGEGSIRKIEVAFDANRHISRDAFDVLIGAAYPHSADTVSGFVTQAAIPRAEVTTESNPAAGDRSRTLPLPILQTITCDLGGQVIVMSNRIVRIASDLPPPEAMTIPAGAKLVDSRRIATRKAMDDLERPPNQRQ